MIAFTLDDADAVLLLSLLDMLPDSPKAVRMAERLRAARLRE